MNVLFCAKLLSHTAKRFFFTALSLLCKLLALSGNRNYHTVIFSAQNGIIQYLQKLIELQMRVFHYSSEFHITDFAVS